jgi:hypothetical protein
MSLTAFFGLLGGIVVLAFLANRLAGWARVPDVLVLMAAGMLLGPVFHLLDPSKFESVAHGFCALALILILFEAGLDLEFRNTLRHFPGGVLPGPLELRSVPRRDRRVPDGRASLRAIGRLSGGRCVRVRQQLGDAARAPTDEYRHRAQDHARHGRRAK